MGLAVARAMCCVPVRTVTDLVLEACFLPGLFSTLTPRGASPPPAYDRLLLRAGANRN